MKKCKNCKSGMPDRRGLYCDKCLKTFRDTHVTTSEERQQDKIQCKICGKYFVLLAAHTFPVHGLTGREYREMFGYDVKKGLIPEHYRQARQALNKKHCAKILKNIVGRGAKNFTKVNAGKYKRSAETVGRLVKQFNEIGPITEETRKKMSLARKGRYHSGETKKKMSMARKKYWAAKHAK